MIKKIDEGFLERCCIGAVSVIFSRRRPTDKDKDIECQYWIFCGGEDYWAVFENLGKGSWARR